MIGEILNKNRKIPEKYHRFRHTIQKILNK